MLLLCLSEQPHDRRRLPLSVSTSLARALDNRVVVAHPRILVVDDDAAILDSLRRALELEGYEVRTAVEVPVR